MIKRIFSALFVLVFMASASFPILAEMSGEPEKTVTPLPELFDGASLLLADFDTVNLGFESSDAAIPMYITSDPARGKTASLEINEYYLNSWHGFMLNYTEPADLFYYSEISFAGYIAPSGDEDEAYTVRAVLRCENGEKEYTAPITAGIWNEVSFDISELDFRHRITNIEISFIREDSEKTVRALSIDDIMLKGHINESFASVYEGMNFTADGAELDYHVSDGYFSLIAGESSPSLTFDILSREPERDNALLFYIGTPKECTGISLYFDGSDESKLTKEAIPGKSEYVFPFPEGYTPKSVKLVFEGLTDGIIDLYAASPISVYELGYNVYGSADGAEISADKKHVSVKGSVSYDTAMSYKQEKLELFILHDNEDESDIAEMQSIASTAMTSRFEFYIDTPEDISPTDRFAVCIRGEGGTVFIDRPKYISNPEVFAVAKPAATSSSKKGLVCISPHMLSELGAEYAVIDVYLDVLATDKSTGYLHSRDGAYYYYDMEKINELDEKISRTHDAGASVYLRILASDGSLPLCMGESDSAKLAACIDFISSRYSGKSAGVISGFIVGESVDTESSYSLPLDEYIREYARTLVLVHNTAKANNPAISVTVPVSERFVTRDYTYSSRFGGAYDKKLFISGLCKALECAPGMDWSLMLESNSFFTDEREDILSASNYYLLDRYLKDCKKAYAESPDGVMFFFTAPEDADADSFAAMLSYSYYICSFEDSVSAFIINAGNAALLDENKNLIKYLDTDRTLDFTEPYLSYFDVQSWRELVPGFTEEEAFSKLYISGGLDAPKRGAYPGEIALWDFSSANSALGWEKGANCTALSHVKSANGSFLSASLDADGSLVYVYDSPASYEHFDALSLELESGSTSELTVIIKGDGFIAERSTLVAPNEKTTLFFDMSDFPTNAKIKSVEIKTSGEQESSELKLYRVSAHSKKLDSTALSNAVGRGANTGDTKPFNSMWIVIIATVAISSITAAALIAKKERE